MSKDHMADPDKITFSTGAWIEPEGGIIGLDNDLRLYEGHDNGLDVFTDASGFPLNYREDAWDVKSTEYWPPAEAIELADMMIERWTRFRAKFEALANRGKE